MCFLFVAMLAGFWAQARPPNVPGPGPGDVGTGPKILKTWQNSKDSMKRVKINNLIDAEINNGSKDYDKEYIRKHINKLTS